ncbi:helix-turn-helix domain-containing protein [Oscillochloris trichoides DG-6]|uniref:Helix-turn-helix domain-containing protein n=1 Tax=Oscillochloris trichoides DG-6 TaxID=765420 RepID=E1IGP6_9CHLR|nr:helix-turn-helix transcriptional regulator [Oscillochloris trichoides]EFO79633.1 helix-turn-helix domain-containing protein [Oscillochloris trichoides DG-6]
MTTTSTYPEKLPLSVLLFHAAMERRESINTFSDVIGVGTISLRQFILGKTQRPRQKTIDRICEMLNISADDVRGRMDYLPEAAPTFSEWLQDQIRQWGTRSKLAKQTGISDGALRNYLNGRTLPDADQAMSIAEVFQIDSLKMANMIVSNHVVENGGKVAVPATAEAEVAEAVAVAASVEPVSSEAASSIAPLATGLSGDEDHLVALWRKLHPQGRRATVQYIATLLAEG